MRLSKLVILLSLLASSCIEPFIPETGNYDDILFIEARLTNDYSLPPSVFISRTSPIISKGTNPAENIPVSGADVYIICDDGSEYHFYETLSLHYLPEDIDFIGETGKSYKLIIYYNGNTYESDFQELLNSSPVDSITARPEQEKRSETEELVHGLQFFISTHDDEPAPSYYRWVLDATFEYDVPYLATYVYDGYAPVYNHNQEIKRCWKTYDINGIYISSTEGLIENAVVEAPLNFVDQYGDELSRNYSLHARQLTISKETFEFWNDLDELTNQTGGLYESQPFRLEGNIKCTTNQLVNVSGIFEVAGVSEDRDFFPRPEGFDIIRLGCRLIQVGTRDFPWSEVPVGQYLFEDDPNVFLTSNILCFDCRTRGGTTERPPFWE